MSQGMWFSFWIRWRDDLSLYAY